MVLRPIEDVLPDDLRAQVEFLPDGKPRSEQKVTWFYRYITSGRGPEAAVEAGYSEATATTKHNKLLHEMWPQVQAAMAYRRAGLEPLSWAMHEHAMLRGMSEGADSKDVANGLKAAESIADRGGQVKGARLAGLDTSPESGKRDEDPRNWLRRLVASEGLDVVRGLKIVKARRDMQEFLDTEYGPLKLVGEGD